MSREKDGGTKLIVKNRRALFDYFVEKRYEAGLQLVGTEVKSLREGQVNLSDAYAQPERGELFLLHANIAPYKQSGELLNHPPMRRRKLLLHKHEIEDMTRMVNEKGYTLIPLSLYFKDGRVKAEIGLCRGKAHGDKRQAIAERDTKRELERVMRSAKKRGRSQD